LLPHPEVSVVTPYETRLLELIDRLEVVLDELRRHIREDPESPSWRTDTVRAFADEALRDRDA
jgi:hypothetical protein